MGVGREEYLVSSRIVQRAWYARVPCELYWNLLLLSRMLGTYKTCASPYVVKVLFIVHVRPPRSSRRQWNNQLIRRALHRRTTTIRS